jgi:cell wall-associated NlpC family hydrolase
MVRTPVPRSSPVIAVFYGAWLLGASSLAWAAQDVSIDPTYQHTRVRNPAPVVVRETSVATIEDQSALRMSERAYDSNAPAVTETASITGRAQDLVFRALSLVGVNYRRGGDSPQTGLDCSGLVRLVFHDVLGMDLPHRAEAISHFGQKIGKEQLQPGDLIFFNTLQRGFSHVGIYLGDGQFVHAPSSGGEVRVEDMNQPYWLRRFNGARRISG